MSSTTPERQSQRLNSAPKKSNGPDSATKKTAKQPKTKTTAVTHFYTGSILSYTEPETERSGYGTVGTWRRNQKVYEVHFTFADMEPPFKQVDLLPVTFVEKHLVDQEAGAAWLAAAKAQMDQDTPRTKSRKRKNARYNNEKVPESQGMPEKHSVDDTVPVESKKKKPITKPHDSDDDFSDDDHESGDEGKHTSKKSKTIHNVQTSIDPGVKSLLSHAVREGIYNIRPTLNKRVKPFMYWSPKKSTSCIKMLLKRAPGMQALADNMRRNEFARIYSKTVRTVANNERSAQIRQLKMMFLTHSDYSLVLNYEIGTSTECHSMDENAFKDLKISPTLSSEFASITDLRKALFSPRMYAYPKLFDLFCAGLESGRLRGSKQLSISPIEQLITVPYEAHFRLELWYALAHTRYSHTIAKQYVSDRFDKHAEFCQFVAQDRRENGTAAFKLRNSAVSKVDDDDKESSTDSDDGVSGEFY